MNSALQVLFMNPVFRKIIFSISLYEDKERTIPDYSFIDGHKHEILSAIQDLFTRLYLSNKLTNTTKDLTKAFRWETKEGGHQQDSQEFIRLFLFEVMEVIFCGTHLEPELKEMFQISTSNYLSCSRCGSTKRRVETQYDIILQIKNMLNVYESLDRIFKTDEIISDYFCETCNIKVDIIKGAKIEKLPQFLFFNLSRIEFDYETFERVKINSRFEFPLEINMKEYLAAESDFQEESIFELYSIVIHRGDPFRGHYFSYIRDLTNEGKWDLEKLKEFRAAPVVQGNEQKKEQPTESETGNVKGAKNKGQTQKGQKSQKKGNKEKGKTLFYLVFR